MEQCFNDIRLRVLCAPQFPLWLTFFVRVEGRHAAPDLNFDKTFF